MLAASIFWFLKNRPPDLHFTYDSAHLHFAFALGLQDFSVIVGETDKKFSFNFKIENIKILPGTDEVVVSQKLLSKFTNKDCDLQYYIALEPDSTFG